MYFHIHVHDCIGTTPLHLTSIEGHYDVAQLLLEKGAELNARADVSIIFKSFLLYDLRIKFMLGFYYQPCTCRCVYNYGLVRIIIIILHVHYTRMYIPTP